MIHRISGKKSMQTEDLSTLKCIRDHHFYVISFKICVSNVRCRSIKNSLISPASFFILFHIFLQEFIECETSEKMFCEIIRCSSNAVHFVIRFNVYPFSKNLLQSPLSTNGFSYFNTISLYKKNC